MVTVVHGHRRLCLQPRHDLGWCGAVRIAESEVDDVRARCANLRLDGIGNHESVWGERLRARKGPILGCHGGTPYHRSLDAPALNTHHSSTIFAFYRAPRAARTPGAALFTVFSGDACLVLDDELDAPM